MRAALPKFVSGNLEAMTGYHFGQVHREPDAVGGDRLHEDDRERVQSALALRSSTGRFSVEYRWRCADGSYKHFDDQAVLLRDSADGQWSSPAR